MLFFIGYDDIFTSLLFDFSPDNNIDRDFSFSFGFAFDNVYDEFEICSDSQVIEVIFDEKLLLDAIENPKPISINPKSLELLKKRNKLKKK